MLSLVGYLPPTAKCLGHSVSYYLFIKEALLPHRLETALPALGLSPFLIKSPALVVLSLDVYLA